MLQTRYALPFYMDAYRSAENGGNAAGARKNPCQRVPIRPEGCPAQVSVSRCMALVQAT